MAQVWEYIKIALMNIKSNKGRSILTMLGIIIGIASIISIASTIQGTNEQIKQNLIGAGNNPMVGMTVAVAVSIEEAAKAGKF